MREVREEMHGGLSARAGDAWRDVGEGGCGCGFGCGRMVSLRKVVLAFGRVSRSLLWHGSQTHERIHESMSIGGKRAVEDLRQLQATSGYGQASHRPLLAAR